MASHKNTLALAIARALLGTGFLLAVTAVVAQDQTATKPDDARKTTTLGNVTVTAQSRSQEMETVPIPLQIITAKQIDTLAATDLSKMSLFVPGLVVGGDQPTQPSYQLRGISTADFGIGTEPAVGVYVDGVYAARSGGALLAFNDIQRIEVLKGPQGTLFGRNAAAGAISIITNEPSDQFEGRARVRFGNYGKRYADALLNIPVGKDMAFRLSVLDNQSDGWVKDAATGKRYGKDDDWGTRAVWRWNVTGDTRVLLSWDHEKLDQPPRPAFGIAPPPSGPNQIPPFPADPSTFRNPLHTPLLNDTVDAGENRRFDGATLVIDHSMSWGSLTSTTAWRNFDTYNRGDYDGTNNINTYLDTANIEHNNSWYQEFKLSGNNDTADWVAGVSYYQEQARQTSQTNVFTDSIDTLALNLGIPTGTPDGTIYHYFNSVLQAAGLPFGLLGDPWREQISNRGDFKAYAAYGDVIWHLNDRMNLTTGVRFTRDEKTFSWYNAPRQANQLDQTIDALDALGVLAAAGVNPAMFRQNLIFTDAVGVPVQFKNSWNDTSPRAVLDYKFTPDSMGYVSVTKGYKAGGYNSVQVGSRFEPEKVWNYEAGIKNVFPEQNLLLNASVYYYRYNNKQSLTLDPNTAGSGVPRYLVNSSNQDAKGLELEAQWQPVTDMRLYFTGAYIDSTYRDTIAPDGVRLSGQPTGEPTFSFAAGFGYTWHGVFTGDLSFDLQHAYRGKSRCNDDSVLQGECEVSPNFSVGSAQNRTDARLDWQSAGGRWGVAVYGNNVFDKRYVTGISNITTTVFGTPYASITPPRMWGVELRAKF
ncbi:MAG TPA: TonB-dependent receptor [Luteibacter sp.]|jgi:iron complex outermembrane receptor protein|nr:TonB-dependent receptor [Luteibacter sp.]